MKRDLMLLAIIAAMSKEEKRMEPIMQLVNAMTAMTTAMQKLTDKMTSEYINTFEEIGTSSETPKQTEEPV